MINIEETDTYKKTASDSGYKIRKVGTDEIYDEAYDILTSEYEYEETDILIEQNGEEPIV